MFERDEPMTGTIGNPAQLQDHFWKALAAQPNLMVSLMDAREHALPLRAQLDKHAHGKFWIFTTHDNRVAAGGPAMAQFVGKHTEMFACISGRLVAEQDEAVIDHFWSNPIAAWYPGGRHDPNLLVLRFELDNAEIWEPDMSLTGAFKMLTGTAIRPGEMGKHAVVNLG